MFQINSIIIFEVKEFDAAGLLAPSPSPTLQPR